MRQNSNSLVSDTLKVLFWVFIGGPILLGAAGFLICLIGFAISGM